MDAAIFKLPQGTVFYVGRVTRRGGFPYKTATCGHVAYNECELSEVPVRSIGTTLFSTKKLAQTIRTVMPDIVHANGTTADATQVMADLNYIVTRVNNNAAPNNGLPGNAALLSQANVFTAVQTGIDGNALTAFPTIQQIQN